MKNILVLCYQLSPTKGSEYSVAWNYVINMSRNNRLTVIYGVSGQHLGDVQEMDKYINEHEMPNVTFVPVLPNKWTKTLNYLNERNIFVYSFYLAYSSWQKQVYHVAKRLVKEQKFDLIHYLNPIGYREPGHLWKLDLPYMWGPINGMGNYPSVMFDFQPLSFKLKYALRSFINRWQMNHSVRIRKAINRTNLLLTATSECAEICSKVFNKTAEYLPENAMTRPATLNVAKFDNLMHQARLIAVGSLDGRKNFLTIIKALEYSKNADFFHLDIIGDGVLRSQLEEYAITHKLDHFITFHGLIPRDKVMSIFQNAHLHIISSLGEGNPTTIWEAMTYGVPTMTVDHCGMHDTISETTGYLIKVASSENIAKEMARVLDAIAEHPKQLISKAKQVVEESGKYQWECRIPFFEECYKKCISNYRD